MLRSYYKWPVLKGTNIVLVSNQQSVAAQFPINPSSSLNTHYLTHMHGNDVVTCILSVMYTMKPTQNEANIISKIIIWLAMQKLILKKQFHDEFSRFQYGKFLHIEGRTNSNMNSEIFWPHFGWMT